MHEVTTGKSAQPDRVRDTYNVIEVSRMVQLIHNLQWRSLATPTLTEAPLLTAATTATSSASKFNISSTSGKVPIKDSPMVDK
jgi:hypothetical protein